jgi:hypothetical protein
MADDAPKTKTVSLTNNGPGPRTFFNSQREQVHLPVGGSWDGEILEADDDAVTDLLAGGGGAGDNDSSIHEFPELTDDMTREQLLSIAADAGLTSMSADASAEDIRAAIEHARDANAPLATEIQSLEGKSRADLLKIAKKEGVDVETDDNVDQLRLKIATARNSG